MSTLPAPQFEPPASLLAEYPQGLPAKVGPRVVCACGALFLHGGLLFLALALCAGSGLGGRDGAGQEGGGMMRVSGLVRLADIAAGEGAEGGAAEGRIRSAEPAPVEAQAAMPAKDTPAQVEQPKSAKAVPIPTKAKKPRPPAKELRRTAVGAPKKGALKTVSAKEGYGGAGGSGGSAAGVAGKGGIAGGAAGGGSGLSGGGGGKGASGPQFVYSLGMVDRAPKVLRRAPVHYPQEARRSGLSGVVTVRFMLSAQGGISRVSVVSASPAGVFNEAAVKAVQKWKFSPAVKDGRPVAVWVDMPIRFTLQ